MNLRITARQFSALTTCVVTTALVFSPAAADAASKKKVSSKKQTAALKEAKNTKPAKKVAVTKPAANDTGLGNTLGLGPTMQLAAMNTAVKAASDFYAGRTTGCKAVTPMLATQPGQVMAGNFRDGDGNCYVWLNLQQSSMLTGSEICKTTLHEMGHLTGLQHSADPSDVMFAPFQADPIPSVCQAPVAAAVTKTVATAKTKVKAKKSAVVCPPGTKNADYCAAVPAKKAKAKKKAARRA
jgi:hypothetical protein